MGVAEIIAVTGSIIAAVSSICAIVLFFVNRGKDRYERGRFDGDIRGDIKYVRNSIDDIRLDLKESAREQMAQGERITRCEESCKQAHKRINDLQEHVNQIEGGIKNG